MITRKNNSDRCWSCKEIVDAVTDFGEMPEVTIEDFYVIAEDILICDTCLDKALALRRLNPAL